MDDRLEYLDPVCPAPKRRLYLRDAQTLDLEHGTSRVRELEMDLDALLPCRPLIVMQFWEDARLYGFREAWLYIRSCPLLTEQDLEKLRAAINTLLIAFGAVGV